MKLLPHVFGLFAVVAGATSAVSDEPARDGSAAKDDQPYSHGPRYRLASESPRIRGTVTVEPGVIYRPEASPAVIERETKRQQMWEEMNAKLNQPVTAEFQNVSLREAAKAIAAQIEAPLDFDARSLEEEGIKIDEADLSLNLANVSAATAFRRILWPNDLTTIIDGELLVVMTHAVADEHLTTHVYPVSDLATTVDGGDAVAGVQSLMSMIQQTTDGPWLDIDGTGGTISPHYYGGVVALAIRQTDDVHRQIESLLYQLRQARSPALKKALEHAPGNDVSRVEREILRLRDEVKDTAEGVRSRIGSLKIQELTPELRTKLEELQTDARLERLRSEMRSLSPSVREQFQELRREATELRERDDLDSLKSRSEAMRNRLNDKLQTFRKDVHPSPEIPAEAPR